MERGLHFGNVSISLVLLLLLKALIGIGTSQAQGSAIGREPQSAANRGPGSTSAEDGARVVMERGLENVGSPGIGADVTVEDDENGSAGEAEESYGESNGSVRPTSAAKFDASAGKRSTREPLAPRGALGGERREDSSFV